MIADALNLLTSLDLASFVYMFWYYVVFDVTRYLISVIAVAMSVLFERRHRTDSSFRPSVSVLLAGFNESAALRRSAYSLREQTLGGLELIVVDDGSTDGMVEQALALKRDGLIDQVVSSGIRGGKSSAVNLGLQHCRNDFISVVDIDTSFDRDAFERLVQPLADPRVGAVAGNLGVRNDEASLMSSFQALEYLTSIGLGRRFTSMIGILSIVSGAFGVFRRDAVLAVGGWEVGPGEDADITEKLRGAGWEIAFAAHAWALTDVPEHFGGFLRQRLRWNRSVIRFRWRKYRRTHHPLSAGFSWLNLASTANILFYQVILATSFYIYVGWLFITFGTQGAVILIATSMLYFVQDLVSFAVVCWLYPERDPVRHWPYILGYGLFATFIQRSIRLIAYIDELVLRRSYQDPYVPAKVRSATEQF